MLSLNVGSNINQVAGWLTNVQRKQLPFATAGALTLTAFDVRKQVVEKTFPRAFTTRNTRFATNILEVKPAKKRELTATLFDKKGRDYLELHARGGIKRPTGQWISIPTRHIKRTAKFRSLTSRRSFSARRAMCRAPTRAMRSRSIAWPIPSLRFTRTARA